MAKAANATTGAKPTEGRGGPFIRASRRPVDEPHKVVTEDGTAKVFTTDRRGVPNGFFTVDADDLQYVSTYKWTRHPLGYITRLKNANTKSGKSSVRLHRIIMEAKVGQVVDHIDGNPSNNCRSNLRICSQKQNIWNSRSTSRGVRCKKDQNRAKPYEARIRHNHKTINLGHFATAEAARNAYEKAASRLRGDYYRPAGGVL
jgi:hypothetical protein